MCPVPFMIAIVIAMAVWSRLSVGRLVVGPLLSSLQPSDVPQRQRWRWALVGAEMALCAATVVVATTLLLQLQGSRAVDLGVASANTAAVWVNASPTKYADAPTRASYYIERRIPEFAAAQLAISTSQATGTMESSPCGR